MKKNSLVVLAIVWMLVVVAGASSAITMSLMGVFSAGENPVIESPIRVSDAEYETISRYSRLEEVRQILETTFYQDLSDETLMLGAIRGMMASTEDPYTFYYTPDERRASSEHSQGVYEGIGVVMSADKDGYITVLKVYPDTSAQQAGVQPGDRIVSVDGTAVSGATKKQVDDAVALIASAGDKRIVLGLERDGEDIEVKVKRTKVNVQRVSWRMIDGGIGYVSISEFQGDDVTGFANALSDLKEQGMKALVIDVRNNPGGQLTHVVSICDMLLPKGLIVYTEDRAGRREEHFSDAKALDLPMAVLVNGSSASASEILAGSLQDYGVASVVGTTTYGKGIVQTIVPLHGDGAQMQLTTAVYYTPNGRSIHGTGIVPDAAVEPEVASDPVDVELNPEHDVQLKRAVELMQKKLNK